MADMLVTVEDPMALEDPGVEWPHKALVQRLSEMAVRASGKHAGPDPAPDSS